jgi:eukaryotic-like serine/threonine-protein kinase
VVTDFGIAKAVTVALTGPRDGTLTQAGTVIGTPMYMAPEQATGDAAIDHRADLYSFGCLGYELFTGNPPFREQSSHLLIAAHIATIPRPIAELRPDVPTSVADLIARCLAKDPADRPQSARELLPLLDGATGVSSSSPAQRPRARGWGRPRIAAVVTLFAVLVAIGGYFATTTASAAAPITLAVLPFANIAGDTAINYVAEGLFDEVASALGRVPGILIKSRSGARAYRGQLAPDVTEAGARLKADYILTGVVRQDRGRWVLSADLERAADASSVWDQAYKIDPNEQSAAADSIAGNLSAQLRRLFPRAIGLAPARPPAQRTSNNEAYRLYLRGQEKLARRGQSVKEAVELFRQAIREDSLFAPAYSGLSMALALTPWFHAVPPADVHDEIVTTARRALALDSTLSVPHVALGVAHFSEFDWVKAAKELETAVRLDPRNVEARVQYARLLYTTGRYAEALSQLREARSLDPASALVMSHITAVYLLTRQMDSAVVETRRALEMDSTNITTLGFGASVYLRINRLEEAHALAVRQGDLSAFKGYQLAKSGDAEGARQLLRRIDARPHAWGDETKRAFAYLGLGDTASALSALERATDAREIWPASIPIDDPSLDAIRSSPRFRELVKRVGLAEDMASNRR